MGWPGKISGGMFWAVRFNSLQRYFRRLAKRLRILFTEGASLSARQTLYPLGPHYDIDVIDPGMAPGTGTPEPGGMLTRELLRAVRQVVGSVELAAMDVVEVSPPFDQAEVTAAAAHRCVLEAISALAARRRAAGGEPIARIGRTSETSAGG